MARNEEKQLARLNRFYLEQQKQEELKKRPPRPRLDTLNTSREIRKWLPTITRDIDFYVKQMEVPCYSDSKIEEFTIRIQQLKQEYRAYLHKLRRLEPSVNPRSWSDRPYTNRKRQAADAAKGADEENSNEEPMQKSSANCSAGQDFAPISTPVLHNMPSVLKQYGFEKPPPVTWNANPDTEDQPLHFRPFKNLAIPGSTASKEENELSFSNTSHRPFQFLQARSPMPSASKDDSEDVPLELNQPQEFSPSKTAVACDCTGSTTNEDSEHSCEKHPPVHSYDASKVSAKDRLGTGVNSVQGDSPAYEKDGKAYFPFFSDKERRGNDLGEGEAVSGASFHFPSSAKSLVEVPMSDTHSAKLCKEQQPSAGSSLNILNLDYSDSSNGSS